MKNYILLFLLLGLSSCSVYPPPDAATQSDSQKFSLALVQEKIKKGVTTKGEVLTILGVPNLISKNAGGNEVHVWDKRATEYSKMSGMGGEVSKKSERSITIAITYNESDIVSDVAFRATSF